MITVSLEKVNEYIKRLEKPNLVSDGHHTFEELYKHRVALYCALVNTKMFKAHKSELHSDGTRLDGWFVCMMYIDGKQISYHAPMDMRDFFDCDEKEKADKRDGHTSDDVLRILIMYYQ